MNTIISQNRDDTLKKGREFALSLKGGETVALYGNLGAGKTVFVKGVISHFLKNKRVLSPTFIIVRHYSVNHRQVKEIIHADVYRLNDRKDIEDLGLSEYYYKPGYLLLVEWADKMRHLLPANRIDVRFETVRGDRRRITVDYLGNTGKQNG